MTTDAKFFVNLKLLKGMKMIGTCKKCKFKPELQTYCLHPKILGTTPYNINGQGCGYWKAR